MPLLDSRMLHHRVCSTKDEYIWEGAFDLPTNEVILSWNGSRPQKGSYDFTVSFFIENQWTPPHLCASWSKDAQSTFSTKGKAFSQVEDTIIFADGFTPVSFRVTVSSGESLINLRWLHLWAGDFPKSKKEPSISNSQKVLLDLPQVSQASLKVPYNRRICSPCATAAALQYLLKDTTIDPIHFAEKVYDQNHSIYGNWVLNIAESSSVLGNHWCSYLKRLEGISELLDYIHQGLPVVCSIKGPIEGGASPYASGHLIAISGYDPEAETILCMDPAFPLDKPSPHMYSIEAFQKAWSKRGNLAYCFTPTNYLY